MLTSLRNQAISFILLTLALSAVPYYVMLSGGSMLVDGGYWVVVVMWCPGIAGMTLHLIERGSLRGLGWGWGSTRHQIFSYLLPLAYAVPAYVAVWIAGLGSFPNIEGIEKSVAMFGFDPHMDAGMLTVMWFGIIATIGFLQGCISATGEEIGWRGYLVPRLVSLHGPARATLITGTVWALWHFPGILLLDYNRGAPGWFSATMFFAMVIGISFAFTWLRIASGSLWTGVVLHASHNSFIQGFFDRLTADTGPTKFLTGEFGAALAATTAVTGYIVWRRTMRTRGRDRS